MEQRCARAWIRYPFVRKDGTTSKAQRQTTAFDTGDTTSRSRAVHVLPRLCNWSLSPSSLTSSNAASPFTPAPRRLFIGPDLCRPHIIMRKRGLSVAFTPSSNILSAHHTFQTWVARLVPKSTGYAESALWCIRQRQCQMRGGCSRESLPCGSARNLSDAASVDR